MILRKKHVRIRRKISLLLLLYYLPYLKRSGTEFGFHRKQLITDRISECVGSSVWMKKVKMKAIWKKRSSFSRNLLAEYEEFTQTSVKPLSSFESVTSRM